MHSGFDCLEQSGSGVCVPDKPNIFALSCKLAFVISGTSVRRQCRSLSSQAFVQPPTHHSFAVNMWCVGCGVWCLLCGLGLVFIVFGVWCRRCGVRCASPSAMGSHAVTGQETSMFFQACFESSSLKWGPLSFRQTIHPGDTSKSAARRGGILGFPLPSESSGWALSAGLQGPRSRWPF